MQERTKADPAKAAKRPPSSSADVQEVAWSKMVARREKKGKKEDQGGGTKAPPPPQPSKRKPAPLIGASAKSSVGAAVAKPATRKQPRSAAVVITCATGNYSETISLAKSRVNLADVGVEAIRTRRALTGTIILEIPGSSRDKADKLASSLRIALHGRKEVAVTRSTKVAEIRVRRLDESVTAEELAGAVVRAGECEADSVKVDRFAKTADGLRAVIVTCPVAAANELAKARVL